MSQPLDDSIQQFFIPAITRHPCSKLQSCLFAGIFNPMTFSSQCFNSFIQFTSPLVTLIISHEEHSLHLWILQKQRKSMHLENRKSLAHCTCILFEVWLQAMICNLGVFLEICHTETRGRTAFIFTPFVFSTIGGMAHECSTF